MGNRTSPLLQLRVANPCPAEWNDMIGDERIRHCGECRRNVYNISEMSTSEAEDLLRRTEGRLCVRYYQRPDGHIMTRDCPKGLLAARMVLARAVLVSSGFVVCAFGYLIQREVKKCGDQTWVDYAVQEGEKLPVIGPLLSKTPTSVTGKPMVVTGAIMPISRPSIAPTKKP